MSICPLMTYRPLSHPTGLADVLGQAPDEYPPVECMGDKCAWFHYDLDGCAILAIAARLGPIADFHEVSMP